jgi:predicted Holliday junction resolvase-like endonuclease
MTEQFMPFVPDYPWDPQRFRFIGSPIDGVQFEDDKVIIVEFKTGSSKLSERQRHIRDLIRDGRVEFEEFRID